MASRGDFHTHSTASDGRLSPTELVDLCASQHVIYHALTDHDSTEGIAEARMAASKHGDYHLIPGVEFGTDIEGAEVHMLGLFLHPGDDALQRTLAELRRSRIDRGYGMVQKLRALGVMIEWERVQQIAAGAAVGRPHVAQALVEAGYISRVEEAFEKWIGRNGPAYVEREKMSPDDSVRFIVERGGLACIAHPADLDLETLLPGLKAAGMSAMEVFYKDYTPEMVERLRALAERFGMMPLGGSDYHGIFGPLEPLPGDIPLPDWAVERLLEAARALPNRELVS